MKIDTLIAGLIKLKNESTKIHGDPNPEVKLSYLKYIGREVDEYTNFDISHSSISERGINILLEEHL